METLQICEYHARDTPLRERLYSEVWSYFSKFSVLEAIYTYRCMGEILACQILSQSVQHVALAGQKKLKIAP